MNPRTKSIVRQLQNMAASSWADRYEWVDILTEAATVLAMLDDEASRLKGADAKLMDALDIIERLARYAPSHVYPKAEIEKLQ